MLIRLQHPSTGTGWKKSVAVGNSNGNQNARHLPYTCLNATSYRKFTRNQMHGRSKRLCF